MSRSRRKRDSTPVERRAAAKVETPRASGAWSGWVWPLATGITTLTILLLTLAPTVTSEDSGELTAAAWHFGVPHPPGYPLWTLLCGVFVRVFDFGIIAWRANLFSAVCSTGAAVCTYFALRQIKIGGPVAACCAMIWVFGRWSWSQSVITEVYALNSLMTAAVLWCALRWYARRSASPLLAASLLMGLGMCNHHVLALAGLPLVVWILVLDFKLLQRWRLVLACIGLFVIGLLPYAYLPLSARAERAINWGNPSTLDRFVEHVTRHQYGAVGPIKTPEPRSLLRFARQLGYVAESVGDDLTWWLFVVAVGGCVFLAIKDRRILLLSLMWLAGTGGLFALLANFSFDRTAQWAMRVFLISVSLGCVIPLACLLNAASEFVLSRWTGQRILARVSVAMLVLAPIALKLASHWRACDYSNYWYAYDHAMNLIKCMQERRPLIFASGDHNAFPLAYLVLVEKKGKDVLIGDLYGDVRPDLYDASKMSTAEAEAWLVRTQRRPVYYTVKKPPVVPNAEVVSSGILYHLRPLHIAFSDEGLLEKCTYRNIDEPTVNDYGADQIMIEYWFHTGLARLRKGNTELAVEAFKEAEKHGWGIREVYNNIGSALGEHKLPDEAKRYFEIAAELDWRYLLPRSNLFRLAMAQGRHADAKRYLLEILRAEPDNIRALNELGTLLITRLQDGHGALNHWRKSLLINPDQPALEQRVKSLEASLMRGPR